VDLEPAEEGISKITFEVVSGKGEIAKSEKAK